MGPTIHEVTYLVTHNLQMLCLGHRNWPFDFRECLRLRSWMNGAMSIFNGDSVPIYTDSELVPTEQDSCRFVMNLFTSPKDIWLGRRQTTVVEQALVYVVPKLRAEVKEGELEATISLVQGFDAFICCSRVTPCHKFQG